MEVLDALVLDLVGHVGLKEADVKEAQEIPEALGMPPPQRNKMSGMTLFALCGLTPDTEWSAARRRPCTVTKDIMDYIKEHYRADYAPNTRENFRRHGQHLQRVAMRRNLPQTLLDIPKSKLLHHHGLQCR